MARPFDASPPVSGMLNPTLIGLAVWAKAAPATTIAAKTSGRTPHIEDGTDRINRLRMDDRSPIGMLAKNHGLGRTLGMVN